VELSLDLPAVFGVASELSRKHTTAIGNRAYDILQVAAAAVLNAGEFLSFDEKQRKLAAAT
jgi:predicted nucleic acid-binding protein